MTAKFLIKGCSAPGGEKAANGRRRHRSGGRRWCRSRWRGRQECGGRRPLLRHDLGGRRQPRLHGRALVSLNACHKADKQVVGVLTIFSYSKYIPLCTNKELFWRKTIQRFLFLYSETFVDDFVLLLVLYRYFPSEKVKGNPHTDLHLCSNIWVVEVFLLYIWELYFWLNGYFYLPWLGSPSQSTVDKCRRNRYNFLHIQCYFSDFSSLPFQEQKCKEPAETGSEAVQHQGGLSSGFV